MGAFIAFVMGTFAIFSSCIYCVAYSRILKGRHSLVYWLNLYQCCCPRWGSFVRVKPAAAECGHQSSLIPNIGGVEVGQNSANTVVSVVVLWTRTQLHNMAPACSVLSQWPRYPTHCKHRHTHTHTHTHARTHIFFLPKLNVLWGWGVFG